MVVPFDVATRRKHDLGRDDLDRLRYALGRRTVDPRQSLFAAEGMGRRLWPATRSWRGGPTWSGGYRRRAVPPSESAPKPALARAFALERLLELP